jgi:hypothetical protein
MAYSNNYINSLQRASAYSRSIISCIHTSVSFWTFRITSGLLLCIHTGLLNWNDSQCVHRRLIWTSPRRVRTSLWILTAPKSRGIRKTKLVWLFVFTGGLFGLLQAGFPGVGTLCIHRKRLDFAKLGLHPPACSHRLPESVCTVYITFVFTRSSWPSPRWVFAHLCVHTGSQGYILI